MTNDTSYFLAIKQLRYFTGAFNRGNQSLFKFSIQNGTIKEQDGIQSLSTSTTT
ncbi:hypothetical protein MED222_05425 [Vibrio sp. MED222]|nr:hypothetical protein MED222_05425 [Vibrio sp. MED222]